MLSHDAFLESEHPRQEEVISVEEDQVFTPGMKNACIAGCSQTAVLLVNIIYPGKAGCHFRCIISGTIVNNDDFFIGIILAVNALNGLSKKTAMVKTRNNHRD